MSTYTVETDEPRGDAIRICVELYRGAANQELAGTSLEDWDGTLPDDALAWLAEQGYGPDDPDLWVNLVAEGEWAPNNHPIAEYWITL